LAFAQELQAASKAKFVVLARRLRPAGCEEDREQKILGNAEKERDYWQRAFISCYLFVEEVKKEWMM